MFFLYSLRILMFPNDWIKLNVAYTKSALQSGKKQSYLLLDYAIIDQTIVTIAIFDYANPYQQPLPPTINIRHSYLETNRACALIAYCDFSSNLRQL